MSSLVECISIIRDPCQESKHVAVNALRNEKSCKKEIKAKQYKAILQPDYVQKVLNSIF